jgi:hypothetical protein
LSRGTTGASENANIVRVVSNQPSVVRVYSSDGRLHVVTREAFSEWQELVNGIRYLDVRPRCRCLLPEGLSDVPRKDRVRERPAAAHRTQGHLI